MKSKLSDIAQKHLSDNGFEYDELKNGWFKKCPGKEPFKFNEILLDDDYSECCRIVNDVILMNRVDHCICNLDTLMSTGCTCKKSSI